MWQQCVWGATTARLCAARVCVRVRVCITCVTRTAVSEETHVAVCNNTAGFAFDYCTRLIFW